MEPYVKNTLMNKKILFIGPKTFNYEQEIIKCLERMGASVDYYNDRPFESNVKKILLRLAPRLLKNEVNDYFLSIVEKSKSVEYDYVFCIKLECFPLLVLEQLKKEQETAKFIFYTWDSFSNNSNPLSCLTIFDRILTFDSEDAISKGLIHRPLFYINEYARVGECTRQYDVSFVGSVHTHRYQLIKQLLQSVDTKYQCYMYLFVPSKLLFFARKLFLFPIYGHSKVGEFKFSSLNQQEIVALFSKSKAILDICHHNQSGLTMRSVEALGAKRKLITNNVNIEKYDFFNPQNILILDENNIQISNEFLDSDFEPINSDIYTRYSINGWVEEIFEL
jgi:hypothetical protein